MKDPPAYERDPYRTELATVVEGVGHDARGPWAVLEDTVLYPEGGGQPADHGWLGEAGVVHVERAEGRILHRLESPVAPGAVVARLDWARRFDHMQQHTAQHLLTALALDRFGLRTTAFHLGAVMSDIELGVGSLSRDRLDALEDAVATEVRAARPVTARRASQDELGRLAIRSRGLPEGFSGEIRLVEIAGIDLNTCGGTHVRSTAELEAVALLGTEPIRGGTRLFFVAGGRLRRRLAAHEARNASLRAVLDAAEDDFVALVQRRKDELRETERRARRLEEELAAAQAEAAAALPGTVVDVHLEGRDASLLQRFARTVAGLAPHKLALITTGGAQGGVFVVVGGDACEIDVQALGREVAALLEGRGGGAGKLFQGKAASFAARDQALALMRRRVPGTPG
jgi:alanyl-tRNA synthetase